MAKLNKAAREAVESLLSTYSDLSQAQERVGKRGHDFGITVSNEKDDSDFVSVTIKANIAAKALDEQKALIARALAKHGITVA